MPGVIRRYRGLFDGHPLLGFGGRDKIASGALLATALTTGGVSEQQTVTITGTPTGGTFTLTFDGATTAPIAFNATAANVVTALTALANIGTGGVTATGGALPGTPVVVTFAGPNAKQNVAQMTANAAALTGGTTPAVTVTTNVAGSAIDSGILVAKRGLILMKGGVGNSKMIPWDGVSSTTVMGVMARTVEGLDITTVSDTDVPYYEGPGCTFNAIVLAAVQPAIYTAGGITNFATWAQANGNRVKTPAS